MKSIGELRRMRRKLADRRRRIIFNNDGDDLIGYLGEQFEDKEAATRVAQTADGLLRVRTTALLGSHVDSIFYYSTWGMKLHYSGGPFARLYRADCPEKNVSVRNHEALLANEGKDSLEIMIDTGHARGLEVFYSNRMNDCHDSYFDGIDYVIRKEHPEWCMGTKEEGRKYPYPDPRSMWTAWDFERPEVRDLTVEAMREVCRAYDVDGIELDFLRGLLYFRPNFELRPVERRHVELMTDMVRRIRAATEEEGLRRGRPILLAASMLGDLAVPPVMGIDIEGYMREGLIDLVTVWNTGVCTSPMKGFIDTAHRHGVKAYTMVNSFVKADRERDQPVWRGDAMVRWFEGADGMYMFNYFDPTLATWWQIGDPKVLADLDKTYTWDFLYSQLRVGDMYWDRRREDRPKSVEIRESGAEPFPLFVAEDLARRAPKGQRRQLKLQVRVSDLTDARQLAIRINGKKTRASAWRRTGDWLMYNPSADEFRKGENVIKASAAAGADGKYPRIHAIRLDVQHVKGTQS